MSKRIGLVIKEKPKKGKKQREENAVIVTPGEELKSAEENGEETEA